MAKPEILEHRYITADEIISFEPVCLAEVIVTVNVIGDGGSSTVYVYNGRNASSPIVAALRVPSNESRFFPFGTGILCQNGLFIDVDSNTNSVTVIWFSPEE